MRLVKRFKRNAIYWAARLLILVCNTVPRQCAVFIGSWIGLAAWKVIVKDRHKVHRHLSLVYGNNLNHHQRESIGQALYINLCKNLTDLFRLRKHYHTEIKDLITVDGMKHMEAAYQDGKGLVGVTGHIGNFELLAAYLASLGYEIAVISRKMYDPRLDRWMLENRRAVGLTNFRTTDPPQRIYSWLKRGKAIGVLIDTDSTRVRGMFLPAFGRLSYIPVGQTVIGLKAGSAFLPMACLRTPGNRYRVIIKPPVEVTPSGDFDTDVAAVTLKCTRALEEIVHEYKDQWIWMHNRWRSKA